MLIKYNLLAVIGAVVGLLNTILTWKLLGATAAADVWLLGLAVVSILALLVLMGVEQFLVFYTSALTDTPDEAGSFVSIVLAWAILSGIVFSAISFLASDLLVGWFAGGLSAEESKKSALVLELLLPQVAAAPLLHVTRCVLNAHEKYGKSYTLSLIIPSTLLVALLYFVIAEKGGVFELAGAIAIAAVLQLLICGVMIKPFCSSFPSSISNSLRELIKNSVTMRLGHSFHSFFFGLILNNALSYQAAGAISIFQYAKRFAEGVFAITIGPQVSIYHARQALAWSVIDRIKFKENAKQYLRIVMPLFIIVSLLVYVLMPTLLDVLSTDGARHAIDLIKITFFVLILWNGIVSIETIFVGVIITARKSMIFWLVNLVFVASFYFCVKLISYDMPVWSLAVAAVLSQIVSFISYWIAATYYYQERFLVRSERVG